MEIFKTSIKIGNKTIKNRIVLPPMAPNGFTGSDYMVTEDSIKHYSAYGDSGVGFIIIEACAVRKMNEPRGTIGLFDEKFIPGLKKLADSIHKYGSVAVVQLINTGLSIMKEDSIDDINKEDFISYQKDFSKAAEIVKKAGFDGIELHVANGFYLNQVLQKNERGDEYGKSIENRTKYLTEIIKETRERTGKDFIIGVKLGTLNSEAETLFAAKAFENAGIDYIHLSFGCNGFLPAVDGIDYRTYIASLIKKDAKIPVICVGGYKTAEQIENALEKGYADMVAVGTAQLADHYFARKILNGEAPTPCLKCKKCAWQTDGRKCPLAKYIFR